MGTKRNRAIRDIVSLAMFYAEQAGGDAEFVIPEDLTELGDAELATLHEQAVANFDAMYGDGSGLSDQDFAALKDLTTGIEALAAETAARETAAAERAEEAAALAARVRGEMSDAGDGDDDEEAEDGEDVDGDEEAEDGDDADGDEDDNPEELEAAAAARRRGETRIPLSSIGRRRQAAPRRTEASGTIREVMVASGERGGFGIGQAIDFADAGQIVDTHLGFLNRSRYESAQKAGIHISEQHPVLQINRPIPEELKIKSNDPEHVRSVFERAADEKRLPAGSLVASGTGWCAPSQVIYDFFDQGESRDGMLSLPEVGMPRGGLSWTQGPLFGDLFSAISSGEIGFHFTEQDDIDGKYEPGTGENAGTNVVGPKPCYHIECPPFEEYRLDVDGICVTAGLLQSKGYPEVISDTVQKILIGHEHYLNGKMISAMAADSTAVTMPSVQVGTTAPLLTAIELQVEHYRYTHRLARTATLEAVFPYWVRGAVRSDLSRRLGVDLIDVPDSRIDAWFRSRGIVPQYVYNWQAIDATAAAAFNAWPSTVSFLLYKAGTWIRGAADVITLETLYDSVLLSTNDYTALFTEEGWVVAKRGIDSRLVTTSITADGATHMGVDIAHNGTLVAAPVAPGATAEAPLFTSDVTPEA